MASKKNSEGDHRRYQSLVDDGTIESIVDALANRDYRYEGGSDDDGEFMENDLLFAFVYLRKMRKELVEGIFDSLRTHQPAIMALVDALAAVGVKESDINGAFGMNTSAVRGIMLPNGAIAAATEVDRGGN